MGARAGVVGVMVATWRTEAVTVCFGAVDRVEFRG